MSALRLAVDTLKRKPQPVAAGARWTSEEDAQLCSEYDGGTTIPERVRHNCTMTAITLRLVKLRRIDPETVRFAIGARCDYFAATRAATTTGVTSTSDDAHNAHCRTSIFWYLHIGGLSMRNDPSRDARCPDAAIGDSLRTPTAIWSYQRGAEVLDIKVGYRCNDDCLHCVVDPVRRRLNNAGERDNLTTTEVEELIDDAVRMQAKAVVLTGGEVTIRPDFERLLATAHARGLKIIIQTNGRALSSMERCRCLTQYPDILLIVALHGSRAEVHERITRRQGSFAQTCAAIANLRSIGREVAAKIVLSRYNHGEILATAKLARRLDVNEFCVTFPHALDFTEERFQEVMPTYASIRQEIETACSYAAWEGLPMSFETIPFCIVPDQPEFWRRNCDLHSAARRTRSIQTPAAEGHFDWETLRPAMKTKSNSCRVCVFDPICEGPWHEYVEACGFQEFQPVPLESVEAFLSCQNM